jgi:hypothetical protein
MELVFHKRFHKSVETIGYPIQVHHNRRMKLEAPRTGREVERQNVTERYHAVHGI